MKCEIGNCQNEAVDTLIIANVFHHEYASEGLSRFQLAELANRTAPTQEDKK